MEINLKGLKGYKKTDRIYILGSGRSIMNVSKKEWKHIEEYDTIGFNHWYVHKHKPTFYDLSYLANAYFEDKEIVSKFYSILAKHIPDLVI